MTDATPTPSQTSTPSPAPEPTSWRDTLPEDIRGEKSLADIKDVGGLAKGYVEAQRMIGNSVRVPGQDAGKEDLDKFYSRLLTVPGVMRMPDASDKAAMEQIYTKLGRPASAADYKIVPPDGLPKGVAFNEAAVKAVSEVAHQLGLNNSQLQGLVNWQVQDTIQRAEQNANEAKNNEVELRKEFGPAYDQRIGAAKLFIDKYADADTAKELKEGLLVYPGMARLFAKAGLEIMEDTQITGRSGLAPTTAELRTQIAEIKNNSQHPYHDASKPGHREAVERVNKMYEQIGAAENAA